MFFSFLATVLFLIVVEGLLTAFGVRPLFYEDPFVGFASYSPLFEEVTTEGGTVVYQTSKPKLKWFNKQSFPKNKAKNTYRIFCLGGSTTMGRPYDDKTSYSRWLRDFLNAADPTRNYEVINAGGVSYASYRVAQLMGELVQYEPDLFIVYTGHNEFLERHTYRDLLEIPESIRNMNSLLSRTRIYSSAQRLLNPPVSESSTQAESSDQKTLSTDVNAILDRTLGPETYQRDQELRSQVLTHFEYTLIRIVNMAQHSGANVILVEPASNLRDCRPFKSQHQENLSIDELKRWDQFVALGQQAMTEQQWEKALTAFDQAIEIDDRVASLHFEHGQALWKLDQFAEARKSFVRAKDEDVCPLRALTEIQTSVKQVAHQQQVPLIPFATILDSQAEHNIPGADQFLDHVHPTIDSHRRLAEILLDQLIEQNLVQPGTS